MTNEEIQKKIQEYQIECKKALLSGYATFELNHQIVEYKNKINALREKCTHRNDKFEVQSFNGRCQYCGKQL